MNVWKLSWRVSQQNRRTFWVGWSAFVVFFTMPAVAGWVLGRGFGAMSNTQTTQVIWWALALAAVEAVRMAAIHLAAIEWTQAWVHMQTLLRANLLMAQVTSGGPEAGVPAASAGEALTHFREDTEDVANFIDGLVDVSGGLVFTVAAGFILGAANLTAAAVLILPLFGVAVATRILDNRIREYRRADRLAAASVSGLVGDVMSAAGTIKVNNAVHAVVEQLSTLVAKRRVTAVRDQVLDEGVQAFSRGAADVGLGLVLLVSAGALATGAFDVGQLALFAAYLGWLSFLPRMIGRVLARRRQAEVAFDRMRQLVGEQAVERTVAPQHLPIGERDQRMRPLPDRPERIPLDRLDVEALSVSYRVINPDELDGAPGRQVLDDISFTIRRGEFVVITGPVGAGKTSLLRALLGLAWGAQITGSIRWNGVEVEDPAAFFIPPLAGYLPQVPHLLSDTVGDNIALGPIDADSIQQAAQLAAFSSDLALFPSGIDTMIGPRGLRLSGGQRQRLATARALVHSPEIVVLDDLSSALDVETELELWSNLANAKRTVLAVSHRAVAFDRADQVLTLQRGRLVSI